MKGLKSMIDDLPEDIRQKYESEINSTLEKVKESNVEEKDLMNEPEFQEIQAQFPPPTEETQKPDEVKTETPTDGITEETNGEPKTDSATEEEPKTDGETTEIPTSDGETTTTTDGETTTTTDGETTTTTTTEETNGEPKTDGETPDTTETPTTDGETTTTTTTDGATNGEPNTTVVTPSDTTTTTDTTNGTETTTTVVTPSDTTTTTAPTTDTSVTTDTTVATPSDGVTLKREDLKESPLLVQPSTGESGKYIFVPKDLVEKVIDFLLNNGCEVTTINLK